MPRYFFHIHDGDELIDDQGTVLAGHDQARAYAITVAGELLRNAGKTSWDGTEWRLRVTDDEGNKICTLMFVVEYDDIA